LVAETDRKWERSGYYSSGLDHLQDIKRNFIAGQGKNYDLLMFYAFVKLDKTDLTFASRCLNANVGTEAGLETEGGGEIALPYKKKALKTSVLDEILSRIRTLSDNAIEQFNQGNQGPKRMVHRVLTAYAVTHLLYHPTYDPSKQLDFTKKEKNQERMQRLNTVIEHHRMVVSSPGKESRFEN
jgi:hypothetical protein